MKIERNSKNNQGKSKENNEFRKSKEKNRKLKKIKRNAGGQPAGLLFYLIPYDPPARYGHECRP